MFEKNHIRTFNGLVQLFLPIPEGEIILNRMTPGCFLPFHTHEESQFGIALEQGFELYVGAEKLEYRVEGNTGYLLKPWVPHGASQSHADPISTLDVKIRLEKIPLRGDKITPIPAKTSRRDWGLREDFQPLPWGRCARFRFDEGGNSGKVFKEFALEGEGVSYLVVPAGEKNELGRIVLYREDEWTQDSSIPFESIMISIHPSRETK